MINNKDYIYIFGHKKPDTDSITSSIALSYLKNKLGFKTIPVSLGNTNAETNYALEYFNYKAPNYINDVKIRIQDLDYLKNYSCKNNETLLSGFNLMQKHLISTMPIVDDNNNFLGLVSLKDIAKFQILGDIKLLNTSYQNIIEVLQGKEVYKFDDEIKGSILVASYEFNSFKKIKKANEDLILIVGNREDIIEYAICDNVKLIIITGGFTINQSLLEKAKEKKVNIIITNNDTFTTSRIISMSNYLSDLITKEEVISFTESDYFTEAFEITKSYKYSNYPVVNDDNKYCGLIRLGDFNKRKKRKVILVDHNEIAQSADGLDEAEIIEVIDHHNIGTVGTSTPINFRNMPVGSTNTILYMLYNENNVEIPKNIAGLMLSGIISDTLLFKSPTTTDIDIDTVKKLAKIANVDYEEYGMNLLKAGSSLKGKTKDEILFMDFKCYTIDEYKIGIDQVITLNIDDIMNEKEEYIKLLNNIAKNEEYKVFCLFATDIIKEGSYIFFNDEALEILKDGFNKDIEQGYFLKNVVSRKKQMVPNIMNVLQRM